MEREITATKLRKQKKYADGCDDCRPHKAADGAAAASAPNFIAHQTFSFKRAGQLARWPLELNKLLATGRTIAKHHYSNAHQNQRPETADAQVKKLEDAKVTKKQERADTD